MNSKIINVLTWLAILTNGLWYYIKFIVSKNGYETHIFRGHWGDIKNFRELINKEKDALTRKKYENILDVFYACF